ncbi:MULTISPECIES: hypothetical protein [unclassified Streptomyces]|uniref:hypothetical protein n=1 Tax=unclassified Streptomyces TaxID=2593676 RepID=UPI000A6D9E00|nr:MULTISPECIES: hypothetical protein [unclassified Streptomyces]
MSKHYRWETSLEARRSADPGIDAPERIAAARTAEVAEKMGVADSRVAHGDTDLLTA